MVKINNLDSVFNLLKGQQATITQSKMQIKIVHYCGCIITQDKKGDWIEHCKNHFVFRARDTVKR